MAAKLVAEEGELKGMVLTLEGEDAWIVGRDPQESQIVVEDSSVSRKHLKLSTSDKGIVAENLSETSPALINDAEIEDQVLLTNGDSVKIGDGYYRFYDEEGAEAADTPADADDEQKPEEDDKEEGSEETPEDASEEPKPDEEDKPEGSEEALLEDKPEGSEEALLEDKPEGPEEAPEEPKPDEEDKPEGPEEALLEDKPEGPEEAPEEPKPDEEDKEDERSDRDTLFEEEDSEDTDRDDLLAEIDLDLSESSPWLLKVVSGPNNGAQFSMYPDTSYVIGSDPADCDIVFHDVSVSRQHARLSISSENTMTIEDMGSSNGTLIESKKTEGKQKVSPNTLISVGTTSFIVYDREGERNTIVSPLLPQIVKILQQKEGEEEAHREEKKHPAKEGKKVKKNSHEPKKEPQNLSSFLFMSIITGVFIIVGVATLFLFQTQEITEPEFEPKKALESTFENHPGIRWSFNPDSGRLLLVGHVLTPIDRNQLIHNVRSLPFVRSVDDNLIVDELVWREHNQIINETPAWRGVTIYAPSPGRFVISGNIKTREQADNLSDHLARYFPYLDLLEQRIIVEENIISNIESLLLDQGFQRVDVEMTSAGEVFLSGDIPSGEKSNFEEVFDNIGQIQGVRVVRSRVSERAPAETMVDLTGEYTISGSASGPGGRITVFINGRRLTVGDTLEGRRVTSIDSNTITLERGDTTYKIDYNR